MLPADTLPGTRCRVPACSTGQEVEPGEAWSALASSYAVQRQIEQAVGRGFAKTCYGRVYRRRREARGVISTLIRRQLEWEAGIA